MADAKDKVRKANPEPQPDEGKRVGRARLRNCDYPLTGSINIDGRKPLKWTLRPNVWTELPDEVIDILRRKFAEPRFSEVPNALPDEAGNYNAPPGSTRLEQQAQYVIEFS